MNSPDLILKRYSSVKKTSAYLLLVWSLLILGFIFWIGYSEVKYAKKLIQKTAVTNYNKDIAFRSWASQHGGVYVPITDKTKPNPHLDFNPERDIETPSGKRLTLLNPAYIIRQLMEEYEEEYGIKGHIVSLKPINTLNTPDYGSEKGSCSSKPVKSLIQHIHP